MRDMYTIRKEFGFSASHTLKELPEGHPCGRVHGHNYIVVVELRSSSLDKTGFVTDYRSLEKIKTFLDEKVDHVHLNDVVSFNPTAENLAKYFFTEFQKMFSNVAAVEVRETPRTSARYEPDYDIL